MIQMRHLKISFVLMMNLVLNGCRTLDQAPITELRVPILTKVTCDNVKCIYEGVCDVRKIVDKQSLSSVRDHVGHLMECNGIWGLTSKEFGELRIYLGSKK